MRCAREVLFANGVSHDVECKTKVAWATTGEAAYSTRTHCSLSQQSSQSLEVGWGWAHMVWLYRGRAQVEVWGEVPRSQAR